MDTISDLSRPVVAAIRELKPGESCEVGPFKPTHRTAAYQYAKRQGWRIATAKMQGETGEPVLKVQRLE